MNNWRDAHYYPGTKILSRGSELFAVDPNVTNEGRILPVPGSLANYPYRLPFLGRSYPVRSIRAYYKDIQGLAQNIGDPKHALLTLRKSDGTYLLNNMPLAAFMTNKLSGATKMHPLLFRSDFYPDPKMSFLTWTVAGQRGIMFIQFNYG